MSFLSDTTLAHLREVAVWPPLPAKYTPLGVAGRGGSATVYEARDHDLDRVVAVSFPHLPAPVSRRLRGEPAEG